MTSLLVRFYCTLTGQEYKAMKGYDRVSRRKNAVLAFAMLIPTFIWGLNGYLLATVVLGATVGIGLLTAFFCATLVFIIEKIIIMSNGDWLIICFRFVLSVSMAILASFVLKVALFSKDVTNALNEKRLQEIEVVRPKIEAKYAEERKDIVGQLRVNDSLSQDLTRLGKLEMNGMPVSIKDQPVPRLLSTPGLGKKARFYFQKADSVQRYLVQPLHARLDSLNAHVRADLDAYQREQRANEGLFSKIDVFFEMLKDGKRKFIFWLFFTVFLCLEMITVVLKIGLKKTVYERDEQMIDKAG